MKKGCDQEQADAVRAFARAILHGSEVHRGWLLAAAERFVTGRGVASLPTCEVEDCESSAEHAEHFYSRVRYWCERHTPWSGHFEFCGDSCRRLVLATVIE